MSEHVTKLNAAMRQLDVAIWLLFADADPISIRTLSAAATTIFADLIEVKDPKGSWRARVIEDSGLPRGEAVHIINQTPNFFKHADRDPNATILFNAEENDDVLFVGVLECGELHPTSLHMQAFQIWYMAAHPDRFADETPPVMVARRLFPGLDKLTRAEQLVRGASFINEVRAHGESTFSA